MDTQERDFVPADEKTQDSSPAEVGVPADASAPVAAPPADAQPAEANGDGDAHERRWHAEAGRKGAHRVHQLIEAGKLYEQEHGLKRGRQRIRQLIELGKRYEQEHGLRPRKKRGGRLSRVRREEVLTTLLQCVLRVAKPSFRGELVRLIEALQPEKKSDAA